MRVSREIGFRASHSHHGMMYEPEHPHDFTVRITMDGEVNEEGFICDFRAVKRLFNRLVAKELSGINLDTLFEYATSENLAVWIWQRLDKFFPLYAIEVKEKPHSGAVYFGPGQGSRNMAQLRPIVGSGKVGEQVGGPGARR